MDWSTVFLVFIIFILTHIFSSEDSLEKIKYKKLNFALSLTCKKYLFWTGFRSSLLLYVNNWAYYCAIVVMVTAVEWNSVEKYRQENWWKECSRLNRLLYSTEEILRFEFFFLSLSLSHTLNCSVFTFLLLDGRTIRSSLISAKVFTFQ